MQIFLQLFLSSFICFSLFADPVGLSVVALGDWGVRGGEFQSSVAGAMAKYADDNKVDFAVLAGDNFYPDGVQSVSDSHFQESFERVYSQPSLQKFKWWVALGNHDYRGSVDAEIQYTNVSTRWKLPKRYYSKSFNIRGVTADFFFIDTTPMIPSYYSDAMMSDEIAMAGSIEDQKRWLRKKLSLSKADWQVVVGHHPLYSANEARTSERAALQQQLKHIFKTNGVDLYISGHDHNLQLQKDPALKTYQIVSGGGQQARGVGSSPYTVFAKSTPGFTVVNLRKKNFRVKYLNHLGEVLYNYGFRR